MIPVDLGLPAKFTAFRGDQLDTAIDIAASDKRFFIDAMPTGGGKSVMYMAVAQILGARTMVLTANKGLQQQLSGDFAPIGLVDVRGQANYPCIALHHKKGFHGCDKGPCHHGVRCEYHPRFGDRVGCEWFDALRRARKSRLVVSNYDFWMAANRYMEPDILGAFDLLILDEAHDAPDKLAEFCEVDLREAECNEFLQTSLPPIEDGVDAWADWAEHHRPRLARDLEAAREWAGDDPETANRLRTFAGKVEFLATARTWQRGEPSEPTIQIPGQVNDWVAERNGGPRGGNPGAIFSPVWAHRYAERFLFVGVPKVVLVSATIMPITAKYLGIPADEMEFREHASSFHPERRPVYVLPAAQISSKSSDSDYRALIAKTDQIIRDRSDRNGLVHTVSYRLADTIVGGSDFRSRILSCRKVPGGWSRTPAREVVDRFKRAAVGSILVGPSFDTGFDFPYQECEYQIIVKMPFIDSRPKVIEARKKSDKQYLNYVTVLRLIQMCGRGMRASDDRCETFILDANALWFLRAAKGMLPAWFRAAIRYIDRIPAPLPKITNRSTN